MSCRRIIAFLLMFLCFVISAKAQSGLSYGGFTSGFQLDTLERCYIHFRHDRAAIDSSYKDNRNALAAIRSALDSISRVAPESIASIIIEGASSPIGQEVYNQRLSLRRAIKVESFLRGIDALKDVEMQVIGKGEDWETFTDDIRKSYRRRNRAELLAILDLDIAPRIRKERIMAMEGDSTTWKYLVRNYMSSSRHAVTVVVLKKERIVEMLPQLRQVVACAEAPVCALEQKAVTKTASSPHVGGEGLTGVPLASVRTNLLVPALNIGAELPIGDSWSVSADYYFPWIWPNQRNRNCFEFLGWSAEGRYWFGRDRQPHDRLKGHSWESILPEDITISRGITVVCRENSSVRVSITHTPCLLAGTRRSTCSLLWLWAISVHGEGHTMSMAIMVSCILMKEPSSGIISVPQRRQSP